MVVKKSTKSNVAEIRTIDSSLINKEEVFRMLALAEATELPLLLVGRPGTGKTKTVIEYSKAWLKKDNHAVTNKEFMNNLFILETDEGTKSSEIKGMPDLSLLFTENKYEILAPVSTANIVVINEVDKASSNIRNSMLGVMNEKFLFNGKYKIPCKWKLFVATCNEIPRDEVDSPFWDRFILKMNVNRVSAGEISTYYTKGGKDYSEKFDIGIPNKEEMASIDIPVNKLEKFLEVAYTDLSDRTLTFVPTLARAISFIWNISIDKALVKTASIMIDSKAASALQDKLYSPEIKNILNRIEQLQSYNSKESLSQAIVEIENLVTHYTKEDKINENEVLEIETTLTYVLDEHPYNNINEAEQELVANLVTELETAPVFNDDLPF